MADFSVVACLLIHFSFQKFFHEIIWYFEKQIIHLQCTI